jgi:hypothetical protein
MLRDRIIPPRTPVPDGRLRSPTGTGGDNATASINNGPAGTGDVKRLFYNFLKIPDIPYQIIVLGYGDGDAINIGFLKAVSLSLAGKITGRSGKSADLPERMVVR